MIRRPGVEYNFGMTKQTLLYHVALVHSYIANAALNRLVKAFGSAKAVWHTSEAALQEHLLDKQVEKLLSARKHLDPERLLDGYHQAGIQVLSPGCSGYPALLKQIHDPPFLLFVRGNIEVVEGKPLAVVGTRLYTDYGARVVDTLIEQVKPDGPCVISGLAAGIDTLAHQAALRNGLPTVAVFGTGIDQIFPRRNSALAHSILEAGGALVSEYPLGAQGDKHTFPQRNRIIAGMAQGTLVIEGSLQSGALITARFALEENRQVMAVPGSIFSPMAMGPNRLIQEGATPVLTGTDIGQALTWHRAEESLQKPMSPVQPALDQSVLTQLPKEQQRILSVVGYEPTSFEAIQNQNQAIPIMALQTALTMLEIHGLITALPGAKFCRN